MSGQSYGEFQDPNAYQISYASTCLDKITTNHLFNEIKENLPPNLSPQQMINFENEIDHLINLGNVDYQSPNMPPAQITCMVDIEDESSETDIFDMSVTTPKSSLTKITQPHTQSTAESTLDGEQTSGLGTFNSNSTENSQVQSLKHPKTNFKKPVLDLNLHREPSYKSHKPKYIRRSNSNSNKYTKNYKIEKYNYNNKNEYSLDKYEYDEITGQYFEANVEETSENQPILAQLPANSSVKNQLAPASVKIKKYIQPKKNLDELLQKTKSLDHNLESLNQFEKNLKAQTKSHNRTSISNSNLMGEVTLISSKSRNPSRNSLSQATCIHSIEPGLKKYTGSIENSHGSLTSIATASTSHLRKNSKKYHLKKENSLGLVIGESDSVACQSQKNTQNNNTCKPSKHHKQTCGTKTPIGASMKKKYQNNLNSIKQKVIRTKSSSNNSENYYNNLLQVDSENQHEGEINIQMVEERLNNLSSLVNQLKCEINDHTNNCKYMSNQKAWI